ncbi:MAG: TraI domain-containing protein [Burkholderiales bacterium]|nr:TraI domain-containing protein [Burkholderiales bacterium]
MIVATHDVVWTMGLLDLFQIRQRHRGGPLPRTEPGGLAAPLSGAGHPSVDPGIGASTVDELIASESEFLQRFKYCYGCDAETFDRDIVAPIRRYASYVNLLPATADNFFCTAGGLFRLGLEVAFFALQGTDAHIVSGRATITVRKELEPRWRQATFLAGLCSELHRTLSHATVTDEQGNEWPAYLVPLTVWLERRKARRFFVRWIANAPDSRGLGLFALPHIVSPEAMQHLAAANNVVVPQMLASITGIPLLHEQSILIELVKRSAALVIDRDLAASAHRYGRPILGAHIERYLLDAMRHLVAAHPAWSPNTERSRVWLGTEGLFIVWPNAAAEIRKVLEDDELRGIPKAPETIVEILTAAGVLIAPPEGQACWSILPPGSSAALEAIRLVSPDILLTGQTRPVEALAQPLLRAWPRPIPPAGRHQRQSPGIGRRLPCVGDANGEGQSARGPPRRRHGRRLRTSPGRLNHPCRHRTRKAHSTSSRRPRRREAAAPPEPIPALPAPVAQPRRFALKAPLRLVPQVRQALQDAIATMNADARTAIAVTVASGVFVPLSHFKANSIDVSVALRALVDVDMLVGTKDRRPRTYQHDIAGQEQAGVIVKPAHIEGLNPTDFQTPT